MIAFPETPDVPQEQKSGGTFVLRYDDISQDGRIKPLTLPNSLAEALWRNLFASQKLYRSAAAHGVLPILSSFRLQAEEISIAAHRPLQVRACYQLAQSTDASGEVDRLFLNCWATLYGRPGHPLSVSEDEDPEPVRVGRLFAEHIFTRPFAPKEERKVQSLASLEGAPPLPYASHTFLSPQALLALPEGAEVLEELSPDEAAISFGLLHTDGNQHVNSLVYPRLFEEAVLRRLSSLGRSASVLARQIDIRYRKPCFVGERVRFWIQTFLVGGEISAIGVLLPDKPGPSPTQGSCFLQAQFRQ